MLETDPKYAFQNFEKEMLLDFATGVLDPITYIRQELADRGIDKKGNFIGLDEAKRHWQNITESGMTRTRRANYF